MVVISSKDMVVQQNIITENATDINTWGSKCLCDGKGVGKQKIKAMQRRGETFVVWKISCNVMPVTYFTLKDKIKYRLSWC